MSDLMLDSPENGITIEITNEGKVRERTESRVISTSYEAQVVIEKIAPQVIDFADFLVQKYWKELKEELESE